MWAAAIVVLLPALAWLQYSWLDQIAVADRERRERTVRTAASQLSQEFDLELSKAFFSLQIERQRLDEQGAVAYAARYAAWAAAASNPRMVHAIYRALTPTPDAGDGGPMTLEQWNAAAQRFDRVAWPAELTALSTRLHEQLDAMERRTMFRRGEGPPPPWQSDDPTLMVAPILQVTENRPAERPEVHIAGFTIVRLDIDVLTKEMLPAFVHRHFADENGQGDFRVAIVETSDADDNTGKAGEQKVLFESEPGAAAIALDRPDASTSLMFSHGRPIVMFARGERGMGLSRRADSGSGTPTEDRDRIIVNVFERRRPEGGERVETRLLTGDDQGPWRLVAKHRAGSLEAAVGSARTRNFALSSGILLLLSAAIGLIIVSARRADRLGRQQMEFVSTVSHELRTPVSVIGAAAGNLADGVVYDPARVRQYGQAIQHEARRLAETVERVLQLAGIASGRPVAVVTLAPATVVDDALDACRAEIEAAGADVHVDVPERLPLISGDRVALRSAVQNLIGNALKYGGSDRWVGVSARATTLALRTGRMRSAVEICVADRGPGIADDDRAHIFEAFYRGRHAVTHQIQGNGLGLHLVQRIVEAHGGRVTVDYEAGPGCRFRITLPAVDRPLPSEETMTDDVLHHDPAGHAALEPGRSH